MRRAADRWRRVRRGSSRRRRAAVGHRRSSPPPREGSQARLHDVYGPRSMEAAVVRGVFAPYKGRGLAEPADPDGIVASASTLTARPYPLPRSQAQPAGCRVQGPLRGSASVAELGSEGNELAKDLAGSPVARHPEAHRLHQGPPPRGPPARKGGDPALRSYQGTACLGGAPLPSLPEPSRRLPKVGEAGTGIRPRG